MQQKRLQKATMIDFYLICLALFSIISMIQNPKFTVASIFSLVYIFIIHKKFKENFVLAQLCSLILFGVLNSNIFFNVGGTVIYYFYILIFIYFVYAVIRLLKNTSELKKLFVNREFIVIMFFVLYAIASIFFSDSIGIAISAIKSHIISISLFAIVFIEARNMENLKGVIKFFRYLLIGILALSSIEIFGIRYGMVNHFETSHLSPKVYPHIKRVPVSFFYNPNNFCVFLVGAMLILLGFIVYENNKLDYVLYFVSLINLIFGMSRTAWITLVLTLVFGIAFFIINKDKIRAKKVGSIFIATIIIIVGLSYVPQMKPFYGKMNQLKEMSEMEGDLNGIQLGQKGSINVRTTLIVDVLDGVFKEKNLLGFGSGNTSLYIRNLDNTYGIYNLHSFLLEILGDYGVIVFILFIAIYVKKAIELFLIYIKNGKEDIKKYVFISGMLMFSLIFLSFAPSTVMNFPSFWILLAIPMGISSNKSLNK